MRRLAFGPLVVVATAAWAGSPQPDGADAIYFGGPVITMSDAAPTAEAVGIRNGRIVAVGALDAVLKLRAAGTRVVDLRGKTLLPGFIDAHGHVSMVGFQAVSANLLPPPDGSNARVADLQKTLREFLETSSIPRTFGVLFGFGYDDSQLAEQRHPTRDDLDAVSSTLPIVIVHQSGHLGVLNTKALALARIAGQTPDPQGGVIRRRTDSPEPTGVLEERAFFAALANVFPTLTEAQAVAMLEEGQSLYLKFGYTTVQDGRATPAQVNTAIAAAGKGKLKVDVVAYPDALQIGTNDFMSGPYAGATYTDHFRIGGVKLTLDGSPQGKTAWLTQPYFQPPEGQRADYAGYGVLSDEKVIEVYALARRNGWQILTHANGDAAIDQLLRTMRVAAQQVPGIQRRPVLIHGQTLRKDQIDGLEELDIVASLFPMHTFYWGDWHRESVLGAERAENISPTGWLLERGMMFTSHHDAPVALPSSVRVLAATVNRTTRTGHVLGPEHRVEPIVALMAMTRWAAYQHFEEATKGSIEIGKLADLVILSDNPLTVQRAKLADLYVVETIKEGNSVFRTDEQGRSRREAQPSVADAFDPVTH
jgi:predicted amidohydrolase YtcJ